MKKIIILLCIIVAPLALFAHEQKGKRIYMLGDSAASLGRGGTGVSSFGAEFFYLNPASIGNAERYDVSMQYGTIPIDTRYFNPDLTFAIPTSYGVYAASLRYVYFTNSSDMRSGYSGAVGASKEITKKLYLGFSADFFYGEVYKKKYQVKKRERMYYGGGSLGFIYVITGTRKRYGFGFFDPRIGLSVNAGYPFKDLDSPVNFNAATFGYSFDFARYRYFTIGLHNDVTAFNYKYFPVKVGLESVIYDTIILRTGFIIPNAYDYGDITAGLGVKFRFWNLDGSFNYSFCHYSKGKFTHYLGLNLKIGWLDTVPPYTEVETDYSYFSPDRNGEQDFVHFTLDARDESRIKGWILQIKDSRGNLVKEYKHSGRDVVEDLSVGEFIKRLFQKRETIVVPRKVLWDGSDENGDTLADGTYYYSFSTWDERDNVSEQKTGKIIIDNTSPEVTVKINDKLFSPNKDGRKDFLIISQYTNSDVLDDWEAGFIDSEGSQVKSFSWGGRNVPRVVRWDGTSDQGEDLPEGLYTYFIRSKDRAGNEVYDEIKNISLVRKYEVADIRLSSDICSTVTESSINFFPKIFPAYGLEEWKVNVTDSRDNPVREFTGDGSIPPIITWDCTDSDGEQVSDGTYNVQLLSRFKSGNQPESFKKEIIIDNTPPKLSVSHSPGLFSPDGDGNHDICLINTRVHEKNGIDKWSLIIISPDGNIFKKFSGRGDIPGHVVWDGLGDNKETVESAADYFIKLEALDRAGNYGKSDLDRLQIDILVMVTERGLKIRISNIEFAFGSDRLLRRGKKILDKVYRILLKYENYKIVIEGHTDDIGDEDFNLDLSERRAESVYDYLVSHGISKERMTYLGMGETVPLYPNDSNEHRRRNRRVEFLLIKREME